MIHPVWSAKAGAGSSTVAVLAAAARSRARRSVLLVDLDGDVPLLTGESETRVAAGVTDWLATDAPADALARLEVPVDDRVSILPRGGAYAWHADRVDELWAAWEAERRTVIVDVGVVEPGDPSPLRRLRWRVAAAPGSLLVARPCYVSLRRAFELPLRPGAVALIREPGRPFDRHDIRVALEIDAVGRVDLDPAVARAADAGRLLARPPRPALRQVEALVR